jgi:P-type Ca2+ transporter type 2C
MEKKRGLSSKEASLALEKFGYNEIKDLNKTSMLKILFRQITGNFIIYLLLIATILSFVVGKNVTGYTILVIIFIVVLTGFFQEYKAEKAIESLKKLVMPTSIVLRDGKELEVLSKEIVPGDVLILRTGEKIPADCVLLEERDLLLNESLLTGESKEVKKSLTRNLNSPKEENLIFAGSFIVSGKCVAKVISTGMGTKFGKIAGMISSIEKELPLQKKLNKITKYMASTGFLVAILTGLGFLFSVDFSSEYFVEVLILIIAISVSAFPEGLPVVLIIALSSGAYRMAKKNVIVNRISIIETLGETTVICSDKTGTITKGEMTVKKIFFNNKMVDVTGVGYEGEGDLLLKGEKIKVESEPVLKSLIEAGIICNDSRIERTGEDKNYSIFGLPTEAALLVLGSKAGIYKEDFSKKRVEEIVFTSERKMMSVVLKDKKDYVIYSKGALEVLLEKCSHIKTDSGIFRLLNRDKKKILGEFSKMSSDSLRVLGLGYKNSSSLDKDSIEKDLVFLGFVGMEDPPREEVSQAIQDCFRAGIKVKMITGDHKETALSIAKQIGLKEGLVVEGKELDSLNDKDLIKLVRQAVVFARVRPEHKLRIVRALKENGEIVTMTGDGVNDSPALKEAHIGVAMGKNGTDVSRSVSDLTLKDDNFATIVSAIKEGRTIFNNIRKFTSHLVSCNYAQLLVLFVGVLLFPILGWPVPLFLALHILFMNILTDNLPTITLGVNKSSEDIMKQKPRKNAEIFSKGTVYAFVFSGTIMALMTLFIFWLTFNFLGQSVIEARTTSFLFLIMTGIAGAYNFRSFRKGVFNRSLWTNNYLFIASLISVLLTVLIIYTPLNRLFELIPIPLFHWVLALGFSLLFILIFDFLKKINNKRKFLDFN